MNAPPLERASPDEIAAHQWSRLGRLLDEVLPRNRFYARKLGERRASCTGWEDYRSLPFTTKAELQADQEGAPPFGTVATYPRTRYVAYHQTSGSSGRPLAVPDTPESWAWWGECGQYVYRAAGVSAADPVFFAFSFGPFIGFWSAQAGALRLGTARRASGHARGRGGLAAPLRAESAAHPRPQGGPVSAPPPVGD